MGIALVGAIGMMVASALTAWATSNQNIGQVKQDVAIVEERENNHYAEVQKQLKGIDDKLSVLIKAQKQ